MSTDLVSRSAVAVEQFRQEHGDVGTWSSVDWEVHQNLTEIALAHGPIGGLRARSGRRAVAVAVFAYAFALYTAYELMSAIRGQRLTRLGYHLACVVRGPVSRADDRLCYSGDLRFRRQIVRTGVRIFSEVARLSARLVRD